VFDIPVDPMSFRSKSRKGRELSTAAKVQTLHVVDALRVK
jgi:hypothetical protein